MEYVPRALADTVRKAASTFPAVLVTGARQVGKTTLLRHEFGRSHRYVSLDLPDVRARVRADPRAFLDDVGAPLILDEIQHTPGILGYLKERIEHDRAPGRWILTGSQSLALMQGISESLAGRLAVLTLDPLSASEIACTVRREAMESLFDRVFSGQPRGAATKVDLADFLLRGGFPEPRVRAGMDRAQWFPAYVQTYLERDVRNLANVDDLDAFQRFLFLVGSRTGQVADWAGLGREVGVSGPTAKRWLSVLLASHTVHLVRPWHRNLGKRIRKHPRLFLLDTGLATWLLGLHSPEAVFNGPSLGPLVETAVVTEWVKAFRQRGEPPTLWYWSSARDGEVDLILERGGRLYGIEVKATATPTPEHASGIARWVSLAGPRAQGVLACRVERPMALRPGVRAVPWHLAW